MPFNGKPGEFLKVSARLFVAKGSGILSVKVQTSPVFAFQQISGFDGMCSSGISDLSTEHPVVWFLEGAAGSLFSVIVGPAPDAGVEGIDDGLDIGSVEVKPLFA